ncbi:hypothetical protein EVAR_57109_1 [Eumeta japonica]|uniref:Uncharacterized protein n=1 Tax=Eumeta variegata TaxID=151549 RepID=A0A4C1YKL6_EUMVA|nr:hypothetical protein EVAR_57109_1 [Eumeta japonica]
MRGGNVAIRGLPAYTHPDDFARLDRDELRRLYETEVLLEMPGIAVEAWRDRLGLLQCHRRQAFATAHYDACAAEVNTTRRTAPAAPRSSSTVHARDIDLDTPFDTSVNTSKPVQQQPTKGPKRNKRKNRKSAYEQPTLGAGLSSTATGWLKSSMCAPTEGAAPLSTTAQPPYLKHL